MFFLMQIIFIVLPSNMAAVQSLYTTRSRQMGQNSTVSGKLKRIVNAIETALPSSKWNDIFADLNHVQKLPIS